MYDYRGDEELIIHHQARADESNSTYSNEEDIDGQIAPEAEHVQDVRKPNLHFQSLNVNCERFQIKTDEIKSTYSTENVIQGKRHQEAEQPVQDVRKPCLNFQSLNVNCESFLHTIHVANKEHMCYLL